MLIVLAELLCVCMLIGPNSSVMRTTICAIHDLIDKTKHLLEFRLPIVCPPATQLIQIMSVPHHLHIIRSSTFTFVCKKLQANKS